MSPSRPFVVVLAAAGGSRAFGLVPAVLATTIEHALASLLPVVVVTTLAHAPQVRAHQAVHDVVVLSDDDAARGLGRAIAAGVAACADARGWVLLPAEMPLVQPSTIAAVARALDEHPVAYAQHAGRPGQPVGFAAELFSELVVLDGAAGARRLVARYPSVGVDVDDPGTLREVEPGDALSMLRAATGGTAATTASR